MIIDGSRAQDEQAKRQEKITEWFQKRPEWRMHNNHPDEIELCGGCGTTRIFRNNGHSKCYRCGFNGPGMGYRRIT